jgi:hypothetical protein
LMLRLGNVLLLWIVNGRMYPPLFFPFHLSLYNILCKLLPVYSTLLEWKVHEGGTFVCFLMYPQQNRVWLVTDTH